MSCPTCRRRATSSTGTRRAAARKSSPRLVAAAPDYVPEEAAGPQPLMRPLPPPEPFPLDALGPELARAAQAICDVVQSPIEMCAGAVLASTSFAVSAHVNIKLPTGQTKPVSCWFWCIAESGERKTATDDQAFAPQKQHEKTAPRPPQSRAMEDYDACKQDVGGAEQSHRKAIQGPRRGRLRSTPEGTREARSRTGETARSAHHEQRIHLRGSGPLSRTSDNRFTGSSARREDSSSAGTA